jgi:hypothetical protein
MLPNIHFYQNSNDACGTDRHLGHSLTTFGLLEDRFMVRQQSTKCQWRIEKPLKFMGRFGYGRKK